MGNSARVTQRIAVDSKGEMGDALKPIALGDGPKAIGISAGGTHTCVVLEGGSVKCWGLNEYGLLGQGNKNDALSPEKLPPVNLGGVATAVSARATLVLVGAAALAELPALC